MPAHKDFKRLVRARMLKTAESYTTARAQLLTKQPTPAPVPRDFAKLAGMSDATIKAKTGCTWDRWVWALDRVEAHDWEHREIAQYVHEKYEVPGWWAQSITVGYERIKGLREIGQRRGGGFEAHKSRTFTVPLGRLYRACYDKRVRARWLPGVDVTIRVATREKSMRITWPGRTSVELYFAGRGPKKSQLVVQHVKLPDKEAAARMKQYWEERLDTLGEMLTPAARRKKSVA